MYNKLFGRILDSSIWLAPDATRLVWITFLAAMDEDGMVQMATVGNVANRARISLEAAEQAIKELESPEPATASADDDGRRIEKIPGGWLVLNAGKYRAMVTRTVAREGTRKRVAEWRARKKTGLAERIKEQGARCRCCGDDFQEPYSLYVVQDHDHETGAQRDLICQSCNKCVGLIEVGKPVLSEIKRDVCMAYVKRWSNASVTPSEALAVSEAERKEDAAPKAPPAKRSTATRIPEDFALTVERAAAAKAEGLNPERTFANFCDYWKSVAGSRARKQDWDATWRVWCRNQDSRRGPSQPRKTRYEEMQEALRNATEG